MVSIKVWILKEVTSEKCNSDQLNTFFLIYVFSRSALIWKKSEAKVFNWSELHLSEVTSYKIHTLVEIFNMDPIYIFLQLNFALQIHKIEATLEYTIWNSLIYYVGMSFLTSICCNCFIWQQKRHKSTFWYLFWISFVHRNNSVQKVVGSLHFVPKEQVALA